LACSTYPLKCGRRGFFFSCSVTCSACSTALPQCRTQLYLSHPRSTLIRVGAISILFITERQLTQLGDTQSHTSQ
jgi:hypothetical protein